jgi:hypothetical protein
MEPRDLPLGKELEAGLWDEEGRSGPRGVTDCRSEILDRESIEGIHF